MDLGAYANIDKLEEIIKKNNIVVPRLRGLSLMSEEELFTAEDIKQLFEFAEAKKCRDLITAEPLYSINSNYHCFDTNTDKR